MDEVLYERLLYAFATPEAQEFLALLLDKKITKAKKMLEPHFEKEEIKLIINSLLERFNKKVVLSEIKIKDLDFNDLDKKYMIKVGEEIFTSYLRKDGGKHVFLSNAGYVNIKNVGQIWEVK